MQHHDVLTKFNDDTLTYLNHEFQNPGLRMFLRSAFSYTEGLEPINVSKQPITEDIYCIYKAKKKPVELENMNRYQQFFTDLQFYFHFDNANPDNYTMTCTDSENLNISIESKNELEVRDYIYLNFYSRIVPKFSLMSFVVAEEFK